MTKGDPIRDLQAFIDERWAFAQPKSYRDAANGPHVATDVTAGEAGYFGASVFASAAGRPPQPPHAARRAVRSPRPIVLVRHLPRSPTGKVRRSAVSDGNVDLLSPAGTAAPR